MFVYYTCDKCNLSYRVQKTDPELGLLTLKMPCPGVDCSEEVMITGTFGGAKLIKAQALWEACMGRGFPEDRFCSPQALKKLLLNGVISELDLVEASSDADRSIINTMRVETTQGPDFVIHFGASSHGATIFKAMEAE